LPDSRGLWDIFWENRDRLSGFAHSHPGAGVPWPSGTDLTTFRAVEAALGRRLQWWIVTLDQVAVFTFVEGEYRSAPVTEALEWVSELRRLSEGGQ
jgi:proteasome lid subunit RPN8/RPN11